jgi:hypothetical protein
VAQKRRVWTCVEPPLVQILVVVASIQMRTLKAEVEKGSKPTAVDLGSVGPKRLANAVQRPRLRLVRARHRRKGIGLTFPNPDAEIGWCRKVPVGRGNASELGDGGSGPGTSSLFFVRTWQTPWNGLVPR